MARHFLRAWRTKSGMSLEDVAAHLDMSHSQLSRIETFKQPYNEKILEALADLYGCDVVDLLIREPTESENMWKIWHRSSPDEREKIRDIAEALTRKSD